MWQFIKMFFDRKQRLAFSIPEFAHANKGLLIIVADPATDEMFVTFKDNMVRGKIKSVKGKRVHVVKDMLRQSQFEENMDGFIVGIVDTLKVPLPKAQHFLKFLDGALFNISKSLRKHDKSVVPKKAPGAILSPFQPIIGRSQDHLSDI